MGDADFSCCYCSLSLYSNYDVIHGEMMKDHRSRRMRKLRHSIVRSLNLFFFLLCPVVHLKEITYTVSAAVMNGSRNFKRPNNESFPGDRPSRLLWTCNLEKKKGKFIKPYAKRPIE